jgi:hypothetical protein
MHPTDRPNERNLTAGAIGLQNSDLERAFCRGRGSWRAAVGRLPDHQSTQSVGNTNPMVSTNNSDFATNLSLSRVLMSRKLLCASAGLALVFTVGFDSMQFPP